MNDTILEILIPICFVIAWCLWIRFCFHFWITRWAKKHSLNLSRYRICWIKRGPYWVSWLPIPGGPVYRITTTSTTGKERSGWVWLSIGYFYGGNGRVTWDDGVHPDQRVNAGLPNPLVVKLITKAMFILPVIFMLMAVCLGFSRLLFLKNARATNAVIIELRETENDSGNILYAPVYRFTDENGDEFIIRSSTASDPPIGKIGDSIKVYYAPGNPDTSIENRFFSKWGLPTIFGILGIVFFIIFSILYIILMEGLKKQSNKVHDSPRTV